MPWLFIDTTRPDGFRFGLLSESRVRVFAITGRSHTLLPSLTKHFSRSDLSSAQGICVVHGPGSFSSVRGGVLVANLLSRFFRKPLVGIESHDGQDLKRLVRELSAGIWPVSAYVMPTYDSEPNITLAACRP